jgi:hypothetical protein
MGVKMKKWIIIALLFPAWTMAWDESPEPAANTPPKPCETDQYRQFDFWVGEWTVSQADKLAGYNRIERLHGGCVLAENWTSAKGQFTGSSLNIYDRANDKWHQTWVDASGTLLQLDGALVNGSMILSGATPAADGTGEVLQRITWTPNDDGSVRQHWESSSDGDEWTTLFDGLYVRADTPK